MLWYLRKFVIYISWFQSKLKNLTYFSQVKGTFLQKKTPFFVWAHVSKKCKFLISWYFILKCYLNAASIFSFLNCVLVCFVDDFTDFQSFLSFWESSQKRACLFFFFDKIIKLQKPWRMVMRGTYVKLKKSFGNFCRRLQENQVKNSLLKVTLNNKFGTLTYLKKTLHECWCSWN